MKKCIYASIFIIFFQVFCVNTGSTQENANPTKDLISSNTIKRITIQVASVKNEKKASQEVARLKSRGLEVFMRHETVGEKGMWYRIYVGQFTTKEEATQFAKKIRDKKIISDFWVKTIKLSKEPEPKPLRPSKPTEKPEVQVDVEVAEPEIVAVPVEILEPTPPPEKIQSQPLIPTEPEKIGAPMQRPEPPYREPADSLEEPSQPPAATAETDKETWRELERQAAISEKEVLPKPQSIAAQGPQTRSEDGRFSLGLRASYFFASKAEDFVIERTSTDGNDAWTFQNDKLYAAIISSYRLTPTLSLDLAIERTVFTKLDNWHIGVGPKIELKKINILTPYIRGALVIGQLEWNDVPGDFEPGLGFEGGLGLSLNRSNILLGAEAAYRLIKYDYNTPSDSDVSATDDALDLSGYALSLTLGYQF